MTERGHWHFDIADYRPTSIPFWVNEYPKPLRPEQNKSVPIKQERIPECQKKHDKRTGKG